MAGRTDGRTGGRAGGQAAGRMGGRADDIWTDGPMNQWTGGKMEGRTNVQADRCLDGYVQGWMHGCLLHVETACTCLPLCPSPNLLLQACLTDSVPTFFFTV